MADRGITLDASALIALTSARDPHHAQAVGLMRSSLLRRNLLVHPINMAEAAVRPTARGILETVRGTWRLLGVSVADVDADQIWRLAALRVKTGLEMPDCCVVDTAQRTATSLATFDARLARQAEQLGVDLAL
jgi:predicted nucleic acid-binding protein